METKTKNHKEIEEVISKAVKKIGGRKENELCKYLPVKTGGYMHHFTFRKMKLKQPQDLAPIIERFVLQADKPIIVAPKQRAARGSRKRKDNLNLTKTQIDRMLNFARVTGDKEIISMLSPRRSLAAAKRELIQAIRHNKIEQEMWNNYTEAAGAHQMLTSMETASLSTTGK